MKNKKIVWVIIGIVAIALIALAITYAYWQITRTQTGENEITTACLDITLADAEEGNTGISLTNQYPLSDTEGAALTPYKFTVTNNCDTEVNYQIALESIGDSTTSMQASSIKVMLDDTDSTKLSVNTVLAPTISGAYASHKLGTGTLTAKDSEGDSVTHSLRLWIDEAAPVSEANKTFESKISVTIGQGIEVPIIKEGSLAYTLLNAYGGENKITELNSTSFAASTTEDDAGMYKALDDYGTSYYYRGNVTNNYVQFGSYAAGTTVNGTTYSEATPLYWRVVRINGDGTIRLIYAGTSKVANGESNDSIIGSSTYNNNGHKMYVGYMYGTESDPYGDNASTTLTDSTIKETLDAWYEANLKSNYETYIADSIFCNDREEYSNDGSTLYYKSHNRLTSTFEPVLTCTNKRDRFTVDDTTLGNGHLTNPVGLITADEVVMAGYSYSGTTTSNYLDSQNYFWTSSPNYFDGYSANVHSVDSGILDSIFVEDGILKARPVINLKADVDFTIDDDGTYVITTD